MKTGGLDSDGSRENISLSHCYVTGASLFTVVLDTAFQ